MLGGEEALPSLVVRAKQEVKWGLHDSKLMMPRGKKNFADTLLDDAAKNDLIMDKRRMKSLLSSSYDEIYKPLDFYNEFAEVSDFSSGESAFSDFEVWLGKD